MSKIKIFQFPNPPTILNPSPFCMKVEVYCLLAGVDYETVRTADPRKAPKGKLPYIQDGDKIVPDSSSILDYLEKKKLSTLNIKLSPENQAHSVAYKTLLEELLYWVIFYSRWVDPRGWKLIKKAFFNDMPPPLKWFVPDLIQKQCVAQAKAQGIGRHSADEIYNKGIEAITALSQFLGEKDFFLGEAPTLLDCSAYSTIASLLWGPWDSPVRLFTQKQKNLVAYAKRMEELVAKKKIRDCYPAK